jgi:hypothetical protein
MSRCCTGVEGVPSSGSPTEIVASPPALSISSTVRSPSVRGVPATTATAPAFARTGSTRVTRCSGRRGEATGAAITPAHMQPNSPTRNSTGEVAISIATSPCVTPRAVRPPATALARSCNSCAVSRSDSLAPSRSST